MGLSEFGFGILMTTMAIGSIVGSLIADRVERRLGRALQLAAAVAINAVTIAIPGLTSQPWFVGVAFVVSGMAIMLWNIGTVSLRQRIVPDALLGRVNASYRLLAWGSQPIGAILGGLIAQVAGLQAVSLSRAS